MIYFLTGRADHDPFIYKSAKITVLTTLEELGKILCHRVLGFDVEANGKRYYQTELLLLQVGTAQDQIVVDFTEPDYLIGWRAEVILYFNALIRQDHIFIGHNLKYDSNVCVPYGFKLPDFFDTMLAEQRINLGSGLLNNLKDTYERHLKKFFPEDKDIRRDFIYMNKNSRFLVKHIMYAAGDVGDIIEIATIQKDILSQTQQAWFVRNVEFPLVKVLSEIELEGLNVNEDKWKNLLVTKKARKFEVEKECDSIVKTLGKGNIKLIGGKFTRERKKQTLIQTDMFGEGQEIENKNLQNINYNSSQIVIDIIDRLGLPKPTFITNKEETESLREEAIQTYIMIYPATPIRSFLEKLLEYKGLQKFLSSYGEKFIKEVIVKNGKHEIGFKNPITHRVHTVLKQCFTNTGRLSSGEKDEGLFNIQNLPALPEIRECFELTLEEIEKGYYFTTVDLSGAELIIMAALANDQHLYELGADKWINGVKVEGDLHSPIATKCWRAVYQYRKSKLLSIVKAQESFRDLSNTDIWELINIDHIHYKIDEFMTIQDSKGKRYILTEGIIIDRKTNKQLRTDFKAYTFGCVYGMMAKKGGETLNIPKEEAQVMIDVIRKEFPKTFEMVERATNFALRNGYIVFNNRSNNRRNFTPVLEILKTIDQTRYSHKQIVAYVKERLDFKTLVEVTGESRNAPIQGTQSDMIKESLVEIRRHPDYERCKAKLLGSVHDENFAKHVGKEFGQVMTNTMIEVANRYLSPYSGNIRMGAEGHTIHSWTK